MLVVLVSYCLVVTLVSSTKHKAEAEEGAAETESKGSDEQSKSRAGMGKGDEEGDSESGEDEEGPPKKPPKKQVKPMKKESFDWKAIEKFLRQMHKWVKAKAAESKGAS